MALDKLRILLYPLYLDLSWIERWRIWLELRKWRKAQSTYYRQEWDVDVEFKVAHPCRAVFPQVEPRKYLGVETLHIIHLEERDKHGIDITAFTMTAKDKSIWVYHPRALVHSCGWADVYHGFCYSATMSMRYMKWLAHHYRWSLEKAYNLSGLRILSHELNHMVSYKLKHPIDTWYQGVDRYYHQSTYYNKKYYRVDPKDLRTDEWRYILNTVPPKP